MSAVLTLPIIDYAAAIIEAAGADPEMSFLDGKTLHLKGVSQVTADAALSAFDFPAWQRGKANQPHIDALANTDASMGRVVEDMLAVLESDGANVRSRLPQSAQDLIASREAIRGNIT